MAKISCRPQGASATADWRGRYLGEQTLALQRQAKPAYLRMLDAVVDLRSRPAPRQHTTPVQHPQVLRHVGLAYRHLLQQFTHVAFASDQCANNPQPGGCRQQTEQLGDQVEHAVLRAERHELCIRICKCDDISDSE